jgi:hypothetical protein
MKFSFLLIFIGLHMHGITAEKLSIILHETKSPFSYNLGIKILASKQKHASIMICCHGYGANNQIADAVYSTNAVKDHIVSFNFPDYELRNYDPNKSTFGTINELLPLLYVVKKCIIDGQQEKIDLYGFSAGGAAIINMLAVLHHDTYDNKLNEIDVSADYKKKIITAIEKGIIILDCPMKSAEEVIDACDASEEIEMQEFEILAKRYAQNHMRPIDAVQKLKGLHLNILLYIEKPDDILGNRDDQLFIERLQKANSGKTEVIIGSSGGHNTYHKLLWDRYKKI